jgi:hypothetical protein
MQRFIALFILGAALVAARGQARPKSREVSSSMRSW